MSSSDLESNLQSAPYRLACGFLRGVIVLQAVGTCVLVVVLGLLWSRLWNPRPWILPSATIAFAVTAAGGLGWGVWYVVRQRFQISLRVLLVAVAGFALLLGVGLKLLDAWTLHQADAYGVGFEYFSRGGEADKHHLRVSVRTDRGMQIVADNPGLFAEAECLWLTCRRITNASATHADALVQFPKLREVMLTETTVSDAGLERFTHCKKLESLYILNCELLTDDGLSCLKQLPRLKSLILDSRAGRLHLTDAGMVHLAELKQLEYLRIEGLPITDAGLLQMRQLQNLRHLCLRGTSVTPESVEQLQKAIPKCKTHFQ